MRRMVRDSVEIGDLRSLDELIDELVALRERLPDGAEPEIKLQGNDAFGRRLSVRYRRPQTEEEMAREARYAHDSLSEQMAMMCPLPRDNRLRIVA